MPDGKNHKAMQHMRTMFGRRQPPVPVTSSIVLLLLYEEPGHGYALFKKMCDMGVYEDGVDPSAIYPTLKALEAEGLIESELVDEGAGPARKVFHITAEGRKALDEFVERHIRLMAADVEYFLHRYDAIRAGHKSDKARAGKAPAHHAMHGKAKK
jgi:PadR family transcriptional regulator, regulatory protein PadR